MASSSSPPTNFIFLHKPAFKKPLIQNLKTTTFTTLRFSSVMSKASTTTTTIDDNNNNNNNNNKDQFSSLLLQENNKELEDCVRVLKDAAKTRKVASEEILSAFSVIEKAKLDPSCFFQTLGGTMSPGRTWMLIYTAQKGLQSGKYFPITAIQRFDASGKRIENGVYLGPLGWLAFEGRLSWKKRILAFIFERIRVKVGPFNPFEISFKGEDEREPSNKLDPFFIWFYIDEEIAVARGKSGGTAFWVRCQRIST